MFLYFNLDFNQSCKQSKCINLTEPLHKHKFTKGLSVVKFSHKQILHVYSLKNSPFSSPIISLISACISLLFSSSLLSFYMVSINESCLTSLILNFTLPNFNISPTANLNPLSFELLLSDLTTNQLLSIIFASIFSNIPNSFWVKIDFNSVAGNDLY